MDTNVWIIGIFFRRGVPSRVLEAWSVGSFEVVFTSETFAELNATLKQKINQFEADPVLVEEWLAYILSFSQTISVSIPVSGVCRDPKDDKFLEAAINAGAQYLISGDKDLLSIGAFRGIEVLSPVALLDVLGK
jgi:putative PIN family toxin of toxin-antitoxin system